MKGWKEGKELEGILCFVSRQTSLRDLVRD